MKHSFELTNNTPIHHRVRRPPPKCSDVVRKELDNARFGIITLTASEYSFLVVIAMKIDGKPRIWVEYRALNTVMKPERWHMSKIEENVDGLKRSTILRTLDLFSEYRQVRMVDHCKEKTTLMWTYGT